MAFTAVNLVMNVGGKGTKVTNVAVCTGWTYCNSGGSTVCGAASASTCYGTSCNKHNSNALKAGLDLRVSVDQAELKQLKVALQAVIRGFAKK